MNLNNRTETAWNNAVNCFCLTKDCNPKTHKRCGICGDKMIKTAHESNQPTAFNAWNIDHIIPKSRWEEYWNWKGYYPNYSVDDIENCQIVHVKCNEWKADHILINGEYI